LLKALSELSLEQKQELAQWLSQQIKVQKQAQREAHRASRERTVVETQQSGRVTYQLELVNCGKARCKKCAEGELHGPYWYSYTWDADKGKMVSRYIGKKQPTEIDERKLHE
jgi:hypothetical protein